MTLSNLFIDAIGTDEYLVKNVLKSYFENANSDLKINLIFMFSYVAFTEHITRCSKRELLDRSKKFCLLLDINSETVNESHLTQDRKEKISRFVNRFTKRIETRCISEDTYTRELLKEQYAMHKSYVLGRINTTKKIGVNVRLPSIPEDISENIIKQIISSKLKDKTTTWDCKKGDLQSKKEGRQECKCFTSNGPISFTPVAEWDVIYFLDAREWLSDVFILYRIPLKRTSIEWKNIKVNKKQTFHDQSEQRRRPRISWESLKPQIELHCKKVYEGKFQDIFTLEAKE